MKKILFIIGSLRAKSFNRQVANVAKEMMRLKAFAKGSSLSMGSIHSFIVII